MKMALHYARIIQVDIFSVCAIEWPDQFQALWQLHQEKRCAKERFEYAVVQFHPDFANQYSNWRKD
jgi:hypothetical protein